MFNLLLLIDGPTVFKANFWTMVKDAGVFAQIVLLILLFLSVGSWAIIFYKLFSFRKVDTETKRFLMVFRKRRKVADVFANCVSLRKTPLSWVLEAGFKEVVELSKREEEFEKAENRQHHLPILENKEKSEVVKMTLERVGAEELLKLEKRVVFLATTGNVSPFFGLLGTVWGVMDSFASIGVRGSASLAVVAPGIAEALIATIVGLGAAIPAVIAYNYFNNRLKNIAADIDNFSLELMAAFKKEGLI
jgi:biopolymer transport protein TolQ